MSHQEGNSYRRVLIVTIACLCAISSTRRGGGHQTDRVLHARDTPKAVGRAPTLHPHVLLRSMVHVHMMTKNDEVLLPHAVRHYRTRFPGCPITVYDNNSTDSTASLAERLGCAVRLWYTRDNMQDNQELALLKSSCWKKEYFSEDDPPWAIIVDADEWLDMWRSDLESEDARGSVVITTQGFAALGTSHRLDLADINVHAIERGTAATARTNYGLELPPSTDFNFNFYSKSVCFKRGRGGLSAMEYTPGAHSATPVPADAVQSSQCYVLKHMSALGEEYLVKKRQERYAQALHSQELGYSVHYTKGPLNAQMIYQYMLNASTKWNNVETRGGGRRLECRHV